MPLFADASQGEKIIYDFALYLREMHRKRGRPPYRELAQKTGRAENTIGNAFNGSHLPRWETVRAIVEALDGDVAEAQEKWADTDKRLNQIKGQRQSGAGNGDALDSLVRSPDPPQGDASLAAIPPGTRVQIHVISARRLLHYWRTCSGTRRRSVVTLGLAIVIGSLATMGLWHFLRHESSKAAALPASSSFSPQPASRGQHGMSSSVASSGCREVYQYRVTEFSYVTDDKGQSFDELFEGDLFFRNPSADSRPLAGRYYGTANRRGIVGYVRMAHLKYERTIQMC